jgi:class 3 adenylate cyclase
MSDGIIALFGAPVAHEDHAVGACYAALAMQAAFRRYSDSSQAAALRRWQVKQDLLSCSLDSEVGARLLLHLA